MAKKRRGSSRSSSTVRTVQKVPVVSVTESDSSSSSSEEEGEPSVARMPGCMPVTPRTSHVSDKARRKIRKGEFVDFNVLLQPIKGEKPKKRLALVDGVFEELEDQSNLFFYKWMDAFVVFMSIRLESHPAEAQGLLRHLQIVKRLHGNGKDGVEYDEQFRIMKGRHRDIRWGEYLNEIADEVKEMSSGSKEKPKAPYDSGGKPPPLCGSFNSQRGCRYGLRCKFPHRCRKCLGGNHPDFLCRRK